MRTPSHWAAITDHMVERILVAMDGSRPATAALEYALPRFSTSEITVLHVIETIDAEDIRQRVLPRECDEQRDAAERTAETVLRNARSYAGESGIEITTAIASGRPARQIIAYTEENDIDRIVLGTHGRSGLARLLLGSLSELVVRQSSIPVTAVREPAAVESAGVSLTRNHEQNHEEPSTALTDESSPTFWWCPFCTTTLYTSLEFCPGCLGKTVPGGAPD